MNTLVCHRGTGGTKPETKCGYVKDKSFRPSGSGYPNMNATFIRVYNGNTDLIDGGDSGSPWWVAERLGSREDAIGLGITSGGDNNHKRSLHVDHVLLRLRAHGTEGPLTFLIERQVRGGTTCHRHHQIASSP